MTLTTEHPGLQAVDILIRACSSAYLKWGRASEYVGSRPTADFLVVLRSFLSIRRRLRSQGPASTMAAAVSAA